MVRRDTSEYLRNFNLTISYEKLEITCFLELISIKCRSGGGNTFENRKKQSMCTLGKGELQ